MARRQSKTQPTHQQDGQPVADQSLDDPFASSETPDSATEFNPANLETAQTIVQSVADSTRLPGTQVSAVKTRGHQEHSKLTIPGGDMLVHLLDKGDNRAGIGIRVEFPEGSKDRPTAEEKEIIRNHIKGEDGQSGFQWSGPMGMWHKNILRPGEHPEDVPQTRPVAIRLDAESRVKKLAEALGQHHRDPVGYAESVQQERQLASQGHGIPD